MYDCECGTCQHQKKQQTLAFKENFKPVLNSVKRALKTLHKRGKYHPKDLVTTKAYKDVIDATNIAFNKVIKEVPLSTTMLKHLQNDVYTFSAVKTHTQLLELSRLLLNDDKTIKSFATFERDVSKIVNAYNGHYLEAEYEFAVGSVQMADRWDKFSDDERYWLQYRTANDEKVREEHAVLHNITLPKTDPFWNKYFAPNGWRCRCLVVQVLKELHKASDSKKAIELGEKATTNIDKNGKNKLEIFRFNPGKKQIIFPPKHPYNKVKGAEFVKEQVKKGNIAPENSNAPAGLSNYAKRLNIELNPSFFKHISPETKFSTKGLPGIKSKGAYFSPSHNTVRIPIDKRRKESNWYAEGVVYHEFGHAIDHARAFRQDVRVKKIMGKYRKLFDANNKEQYIKLDQKFRESYAFARNNNETEQIAAFADTLESLNSNFGAGHGKNYFNRKGMPEAEFLAHAFENTFAGNDYFKQTAPELYKDMVQLIESLLK